MDDEGRGREELAAQRPAPAARHRVELRAPRLVAACIALVALIIAMVLVLTLLPGGATAPTVAEVAELATRPATGPAPTPRADAPTLLAADVDGVAFPAWVEDFGWTATGARSDELGGRDATTVFYEKDGRRLAYTVVSGDALEVSDGGRATIAGVEFTAIDDGVTWERDGHTCVLTGSGVPAERLVDLAAWRGEGALVF